MSHRTPAQRLSGFVGSAIRAINDKAARLESEGRHIVHMEIGRPDFDTPQHIKDAAIAALRAGKVHYTAAPGIVELRRAIAEKLRRDNGITVDPAQGVVVTVGAKEAVFCVAFGLLDAGDEVLLPAPIWPDYIETFRLCGGVPVTIPTGPETGYQPDVDQVEAAITPRTKMLVVLSPNNPTGAVYSEDVIRALAEVAIRHDLLVVSDEIYEKLVYDGARHRSVAGLPGMAERTITINGFSKAYSMTGWRLGYVAAPPELAGAVNKVHMAATSSATTFVQYGGLAAYTASQEPTEAMRREFDRRRRLIVDRLRAMRAVEVFEPQGAFYVYPRFRLGMSSEEVAAYLLDEAGVACVPGTVFGDRTEGTVRFSYATAYEEIEVAMERIGGAVARFAPAR